MPAKFERCVKKVKARGNAYNAYAVCNAALRKARRNPMNLKNAAPLLWIAGGGLAAFGVYKLWQQSQQPAAQQSSIVVTLPGGQSTTCAALQAQLNAVNATVAAIPVNANVAASIRQQMVSAGCTPVG